MPEPAASLSPSSTAEGEEQRKEEEEIVAEGVEAKEENSYFEFRPYRELPSSHVAVQVVTKAHRILGAESQANSSSRQAGWPPKPPNQRVTVSDRAPVTSPPSRVQPHRPQGSGDGQQRGSNGSVALPLPSQQQHQTSMPGMTSSHSSVAGEGSAAVQQPATRVMSEKQIGKITVCVCVCVMRFSIVKVMHTCAHTRLLILYSTIEACFMYNVQCTCMIRIIIIQK